jgi:hypothetical protein
MRQIRYTLQLKQVCAIASYSRHNRGYNLATATWVLNHLFLAKANYHPIAIGKKFISDLILTLVNAVVGSFGVAYIRFINLNIYT